MIFLQVREVVFIASAATDVGPLLRELHHRHSEFTWSRVSTMADFAACLDAPPDVIIADSGTATLSVLAALDLLRHRHLEVPLIVVADASREEDGIAAVARGAADYLLQDRPARLGTAVANALEHKALQDELRAARAAAAGAAAAGTRVSTGDEYFQAPVELSRDASILLDAAGTIRYVSPALHRILGYEVGELLGRAVIEFVHPDDESQLSGLLSSLLPLPKGVATAVARYQHRDGSWRWLEGAGTNLLDEPRVGCLVINLHDVTERKKAEEKVRLQSCLLDAVGQAVIATDRDGTITYWNRAAETLYGWQSGEVMGRSVLEVTPGVALREQAEKILSRLCAGESWSGEFLVQRRDGSTFPAHVINTPIHDTEGALVGIIGISSDLTEVKETATALQHERNFVSSVIETVDVLILVMDTGGRIVRFNRACQELSGYTLAEVTGQDVMGLLLVPEEAMEASEHFAQTCSGLFPNHRENHWVSKDGTRRLIAWTNTALVDLQGQVEYVIGTGIDITERRREEVARDRLQVEIQQQRDRLDAIIATVPGVVWESWIQPDQAQQVNYVSEYVQPMLGYSRDEWLGTPNFWLEIVHPDDKEQAARESAEMLARGGGVSQFRWITKEGREICGESHMVVIRDEAGSPLGFRGVSLDITERKRAEVALRENEMRLQALVASIDEIVFEFGPEGRYLDIWAHNEALLTQPRDKLTGRLLTDVLGESVARPLVDAIQRIVKSGCAESLEYSMEVNGKEHWFLSRLSPVQAADGSCGSVCMLSRDITERRHMEEQLRHLSQAVEQSPTSVIITDIRGDIEYVNPKFCELTGYAAAEVLGKNPRMLKSGETPPAEYRRMWETISGGSVWRGELHNRKKSGELYWELVSMSAIRDGAGNITHYLSLKEDITERKQRETELEAIAATTTILRQATSADQMSPLILSQVQTLVQAEGGMVLMRDRQNGDNIVQIAHGAWAAATGLRLKEDEGLTGQVMASGQPFSTDNLQEEPALIPHDQLSDLSSAAIIPLFTHQHAIGALVVGRNRAYTEADMRILGALSEIAANAIYRATLHEQTQQRLHQLNALRTIDMAISASLDLRVTLHVVLDEVMTQLEADAVCVLLLNAEDQMLHYSAGRGLDARWMERRPLRVGQHLSGQVALERRMVRVLDLPALAKEELSAMMPPEHGFSVYYGVPLISKGRVQGVLEVYRRSPQTPDSDWESFLEALAGQASIAVDNAGLFSDLQRSNVELILAYDSTIEGWSRALDLRDKETEGHSLRVTEGTLDLARAMGLPAADLVQIRRGALLHDIGKMGVPDSILLKPGKLTDEEWVAMRKHPVFAYELLYPTAFLRPALDIPYCHHEKWDGTGYPRGLMGNQIPLSARIFAVIDVWDALRSDRPYRKGWAEDKVREHIRAASGSHFDPEVVESFLALPESIG